MDTDVLLTPYCKPTKVLIDSVRLYANRFAKSRQIPFGSLSQFRFDNGAFRIRRNTGKITALFTDLLETLCLKYPHIQPKYLAHTLSLAVNTGE